MKEHFSSARHLATILARDEGCRVGETAVVSTKVHTLDQSQPATVYIVKGADAGKTFYKRNKCGEVVHIDIFHSVAHLDPHALAKAARAAVRAYRDALISLSGNYTNPYGAEENITLADFIDLQSGHGGGRITGKLTYGQRGLVRQIHENHVHLTMLLSPSDFALIFFLIAYIEDAVRGLQSELRKVERIVNETAAHTLTYDNSAYSSYSDTFLREERNFGENTSDIGYQHRLLDIADILEELEDPGSLRELLMKSLSSNNKTTFGRNKLPSDVAKKLIGYNYLQEKNGRYVLTSQGDEFFDFLKRCTRQIECDLRPKFKTGRGRGHARSSRRPCLAAPALLALVPTVTEGLQRTVRQRRPWSIHKEDLRFVKPIARGRCDILLLLDASASMLGQRMKAAKGLASHLIHVTKDRIGVIYFQENKVEVAVPFTRNRTLLKNGLRQISPEGLTPLALGLSRAATYLRQHSRARESLLVVITDGIPTVSQHNSDPLADVSEVAESLRQQGINLCFIGLLPNQEIMRNLAKLAKGSVYVIDEITTEELVGIVALERRAVIREKKD